MCSAGAKEQGHREGAAATAQEERATEHGGDDYHFVSAVVLSNSMREILRWTGLKSSKMCVCLQLYSLRDEKVKAKTASQDVVDDLHFQVENIELQRQALMKDVCLLMVVYMTTRLIQTSKQHT